MSKIEQVNSQARGHPIQPDRQQELEENYDRDEQQGPVQSMGRNPDQGNEQDKPDTSWMEEVRAAFKGRISSGKTTRFTKLTLDRITSLET